MRHLLLIVLIAVCAATAGGCASTGAIPHPFPTPGGRSPSPASPAAVASMPGASADAGPVAPEIGYGLAGTALSYRGVRYRNGGSDPTGGFDCSGFVWYVFTQYGIAVPRTVSEQFRTGMSVGTADLRAGDLLFFNTMGTGPSHVGISIGGDQFVHAPSSAGEVRVERLGSSYWAGRFVGIRRID